MIVMKKSFSIPYLEMRFVRLLLSFSFQTLHYFFQIPKPFGIKYPVPEIPRISQQLVGPRCMEANRQGACAQTSHSSSCIVQWLRLPGAKPEHQQ
jgi:hypothetical protein